MQNEITNKIKSCINLTLKEIRINNKIPKEVGDRVSICLWGAVLIKATTFTCNSPEIMDSEFIITKIISKESNYNELNYDVELYSKIFECKALSRYEWIKFLKTENIG